MWNVGERVQAFTNPLWLALCTAAFGVTGNVYYTAIALSVFVTLGFVFLLVTRVAVSSRHLLVCFAVLLSSKAFIDYSTSGPRESPHASPVAGVPLGLVGPTR